MDIFFNGPRTERTRRPTPGSSVFLLLMAMIPLLSCTPAGDASESPGGDPAAAEPVPLDRSVLDDPGRPEEEKAQDATRKAIDVYEWLGVRPGMTVADVFNSGGYNTHLLSRIVGDEGKVYSVFEFYADKEAFDGRLYRVDAVTERVENSNLDNVDLVMKVSDLPADGVDVMVAVRNYHDVEWVFPDLKRVEMVAAMYRAVKPGAIVGIVDVATDRPGWDEETHRLNQELVIEDFTAGGFELIDTSDMLANPDDDHSTSGFDVGRHTMDRYLLKFRKPA